ncbi:uncharacterized protein J4E87_008662 [Alternaria ethzedia]|uniref:uncharacterized protein n=1 Tax=Alternaria ethzedia TaxID=181014 RepID=UPI0020C1BF55|nr:uncharacterized protein J4E87_008662 [Alternaria ethzedia]KAI4616396.1 hypothetical protein J4E87_008662 [Alternaria ethzedia]
MASKKFAHWNGFPFMTAPRTKYYSGQTQSPLFRLSREIRDMIYGYYALGEGDNGYHYDSETGKMLEQSPSSEPKHVVRLGLMITYRIAAEELKNCAFRKVQFSPHLSQDDGKANEDLAKLEALICLPVDSDFRHPMAEDGTFYFEDISDHVRASGSSLWYFSAASIAIDFCE